MNIDIKRLRVDADYWAAVAPEWGTDRYTPCPVEPAPSNPMNDNCPAARIGEIGNQVHNLGCDYQNDEDLSDELGQVAVTLWDLAKKVASLDQAQRERDCARQNRISEMKEQAKRVGLMSMGPLEMKEPEWDGTGRPPVGAECEAVWLEMPDGGDRDFERVIVKGYWEKQVWFCTADGEDLTHLSFNVDFRPIRTWAQTEREELISAATEILNQDHVLTERDAAEALYDAGMLRGAGE